MRLVLELVSYAEAQIPTTLIPEASMLLSTQQQGEGRRGPEAEPRVQSKVHLSVLAVVVVICMLRNLHSDPHPLGSITSRSIHITDIFQNHVLRVR